MTKRAQAIMAGFVAVSLVVLLIDRFDLLQPGSYRPLEQQILEAKSNLGRWPKDLSEIREHSRLKTHQTDSITSVSVEVVNDWECVYVVRGRNLIGVKFGKRIVLRDE